MKANYLDILARITEEPSWYDQNGTPRYGEFHPSDCPNIYSSQVVLLRIACQACGAQFHVEMHGNWYSPMGRPHELHYGDPPRHDGCVGDTMNCEDLEILQVWKKDSLDWVRNHNLEGAIK